MRPTLNPAPNGQPPAPSPDVFLINRLNAWIPYPGSALGRLVAHTPLLLFRLGLGGLLARMHLLVLTTRGRKTGQPRAVTLEFRRHGRKVYVVSAWDRRPHWYQNAQSDPTVTVQIAGEIHTALATPLTDPGEAARALNLFRRSAPARYDAVMRLMTQEPVSGRTLMDHSHRFTVMRLDLGDEPLRLPPVQPDLRWLWPVGFGLLLGILWVLARARGKTP